ncbi:ROK family protein [Arthrobacter sp. H5]|uniref:ROK family protein n=1 Tax=Arthrobacter sp. H5 TaxID=1267973 RepID=UPI0004871E44|nr:ROK family protein [Arthrobacter sp. H5]
MNRPDRASGSESLRRSNLSTLLTALHRTGPQTRAHLTRLTGLTRSTIGALVAELTALDLAYETEAPEAGRVGRPSPLVHANEQVTAIAVNPDVDAVTVALVGLGGQVKRKVRYDAVNVPSVAEAVNITKAIVEGMQTEANRPSLIAGVGLAIPGLVRTLDGHVLTAPHLKWSDEPVASRFAKALGMDVKAANDASLGSLAESTYGAASDAFHAIYLNGSASGIGGGVVAAGLPLRGASGYAGELGHVLVNSVGSPCYCGRTGCLETEVSLERLQEALDVGRASPDELERALSGNLSLAARKEVERQLDFLAVAASDLINVFNPEVIVLGGFLGLLFDAAPERLLGAVREQPIGGLGREVRIERAALGADLVLIGAAELAFADLLANPHRIALPG